MVESINGVPEDIPESVHNKVHTFLTSCANAMELCASTSEQSHMVGLFSEQMARNKRLECEPSSLPSLRNLSLAKDMKLAKDFQKFANELPWRPSPRTVDKGKDMVVVAFNEMFEMENVAVGLIYVDVDRTYPEHNHPPAEIYFLISGTAKWRYGGNHDYQNITAGNMIYNHPFNWHGVKAGPTPVLALYLQLTYR